MITFIKKASRDSLVAVVAVSSVLGLAGPSVALAATAPDLGDFESFSALAALSAASANMTTISGDVGLSPGVSTSFTGPWTVGGTGYFGPLTLAFDAQADALIAYTDLTTQPSDGVWSTDPVGGQDSPEPGVWTETGSPAYSGTLVLNGSATDVWVFQISTDFTFTGDVVLTGGAQACNVFWAVAQDATIGVGSDFAGTLIAGRDVSVVSGATVNGRVRSAGNLTVDANTISGPTCSGSIAVLKVVVNDDGRDATAGDFPLFVNGAAVSMGYATAFPAGSYTVSETQNDEYTQSFSGSCNASGVVTLSAGQTAVCTITNNDNEQTGGGGGGSPTIPPLIDVVKVPSPLSLPGGPGSVTYTYTVRNIGPVPMTDVTLVGDTCSPITLVSGDINVNAILEVTETWTYTCATTLTETHTNTVTATGWANGVNAVDVAVATVVIGGPVPPLIHVTKVPNPLVLPDAGGMVTYTERITNPGVVPLSNVTLTDDRCSPMVFISGDVDGDSLLDTTETWTYTCRTNLTVTTTNTAVATGQANGITVTDFAIATVVVGGILGGPDLPTSGIPPDGSDIPWSIIIVAGILMIVSTTRLAALRKRTD